MLQKSNMSKTMEIFFISPTREHYLMDISRRIGLAHTSVKRNLDELNKQGLITGRVEKKGKRKFPVYKANLYNEIFKLDKIAYNIDSLLRSGIVKFLEERLSPKALVVFGSYIRGEDIEGSDIDLFLECNAERLDLKKFEKGLGRKIELHFSEGFTSYSKELKNNIINGLVVSGFLEGYK
jgi:predicted nucleotidyltransferase